MLSSIERPVIHSLSINSWVRYGILPQAKTGISKQSQPSIKRGLKFLYVSLVAIKTKRTNPGSAPFLDRINIPLTLDAHNNTLFAKTIYTQPPSPEVDEAWEALSAIGFTTISTADVIRLGKDPTLTVHHPSDPNAHIVMPTVNHQIHCLNSIRKSVFSEHYWPGGSKSPLHWDHFYHCLGMVLDALQCGANMDPITFNWMELNDSPVLDFNVNMVCRDHKAFYNAWRDEISIEAAEVATWTRQGGEIDVPVPPPWLKLLAEGAFDEEEPEEDHYSDHR